MVKNEAIVQILLRGMIEVSISYSIWSASNDTYTSTGSADLTMAKQRREAEATVDDFINLGRDLMGRLEHKIGAVSSEECHFCELFGVGPAVAQIT